MLIGANREIRTLGLLITNQLLYQLSYVGAVPASHLPFLKSPKAQVRDTPPHGHGRYTN
jgi:hypothetical protein